MITTKALRDLCASLLPEVHFVTGADLPDKPDRAGAISRTPAGRTEHEGVQDRGGFTIRMRGEPTRDDQPEDDLNKLRLELERLPNGIEVGGQVVRSMWPSGPSYPLPGPDSGRRYEFVQVMYLQVSVDT